jgi:hypothetical protein
VRTVDCAVELIDFDSLFHPSLRMPPTTTCGSPGYSPPYHWRNGRLDAAATWCERADRYALALINAEFLTIDVGAPLSSEGGVFEQDELRARKGSSIEWVCSRLSSTFPAAAKLLRIAVDSQNPDACPSPRDWADFCSQYPAPAQVHPQQSQETPAAQWPAPSLEEIPVFDPGSLQLTPAGVPVSLPPDPWEV